MRLDRLADLRKKLGLTQEEFAEELGFSRSSYGMLERGERQMSYEALVKTADYHGVSLDYIFERTDNPLHLESLSPDELEYVVRSLELYKSVKKKFM
ncbi:DNA-binding transcriptional regulator, XRE-family HTH domain [Terribacillus aidingensis]|uniref:DNA-binding transcriptional regulator, XRE-family HTH domain n=1 Tax=Terribacillus aidingensis TaxID=586416 RepID=A0A285NYH2_9BACI|nr:helix-turn-helix transcriptional regulator [Terribacillus aidingensis]SNZ14534.1 DNA-binding transcriptional regulator, XRE-family HTH domain [Terribacillus aidingensis]